MDTPIRESAREGEAQEWALVLATQGIEHRVEATASGWTLLVAEADGPRARQALAAYDEDLRQTVPAPAPAAALGLAAWGPGLAAAALLLAFFAVTGPAAARSGWFTAGAAAAGRLLGGEPWRAITALTLHADAAHALGNALATAVLLPALVGRLGGGAALGLVLLAGAVGNALAAAVHDPRHLSVGASTATFGAIGILTALRLTPPLPPAGSRWRRLVVPVAAVMLVTMMGTGPDVDLVAHVLGMASGIGLGLVAGRLPVARPALQGWLAAATALAVVGAWRLAG